MSLDLFGACCVLNSAKEELLIDASDVDLIGGGAWTVRVERNGRRYAVRWIAGKYVRMHRLITGAPAGVDVDHADRNGLNNRRGNLRICTRSENNYNSKCRKDNKSGFKCVYRHVRTGKKQWRSRVKVNGRLVDLGLFQTPELAFAAYQAAVVGLHGQFCRTA